MAVVEGSDNINTHSLEDRTAACDNCGEIINVKEFQNRDDVKCPKCGRVGMYIAEAEYIFMV